MVEVTRHGWTLTGDGRAFADAALEFLGRDPVRNTTILTVAAGVGTSPRAPMDLDCYGWWADADGRIGAAFASQYPFAVALSAEMPEAAAAQLPGAWLETGRPRPTGVFGGAQTAEDIMIHWAKLLGCGYRPRPDHTMRLFSFTAPTPPDPAPRGESRLATEADVPLLRGWDLAFLRECGINGPSESEPYIRARIAAGRQLLWTHAGEPVACANFTALAAGSVRITGVYTPPEHRRHGYAAGVTWAATQHALAGGAEHVVLHTNLANPTSNAIYQRLGYRPVRDVTEFEFTQGS